jgi:hypothetical protein|tara:strand:+ start:543 stop:719 length:177 start_codon:yes stop_codon:yes gene_type:complete
MDTAPGHHLMRKNPKIQDSQAKLVRIDVSWRDDSGFFIEQQLTSTPETGNNRHYEKNG